MSADRPTPLPVGCRVRHYGHQWPDAYRLGTGEIEEIEEGGGGTWEYLVRLDRALAHHYGDTVWWNSAVTIDMRRSGT
jgi:hypothetical protein